MIQDYAEIEMQSVVKRFPGAETSTLDGLNLRLGRGQIHSIIGYSGVGKSVTMKCILGLLKPSSGDILIRGQSIIKMDSFKLNEIRKNFGMLFQGSALFDSLTVFENIAFPLREHRARWTEPQIASRVRELLASVDLESSENKMPSELSGGMAKRVGLARALALEPKILLFDEPTTGLDPVTSEVIDELILSSVRKLNISALIISHDIHAALRISDFVSMIADGRIIETAEPSKFIKSKDSKVREFLRCGGVI